MTAKTWAYPLRHRSMRTRSITSPLEGSSNLRFINGNSTSELHACAEIAAVGGRDVAWVDKAAAAGVARVDVGAAGVGAAEVGAAEVGGVGPGTGGPEQPVDDPAAMASISAGSTVLTGCCTTVTSIGLVCRRSSLTSRVDGGLARSRTDLDTVQTCEDGRRLTCPVVGFAPPSGSYRGASSWVV